MKIRPGTVIPCERLVLRQVEHDDLPDLLAIHASEEVTRYLPFGAWKNMADAQAWFRRTLVRQGEGSALQFVMHHRALDRVIGTALLFHVEEDSGRAEIGYVLGKEYWGQGLAFEALNAFLAYAFGDLGLRRLEAEINPRNAASGNILLRLGFRYEGLRRERWLLKGEVTDSDLYGLLRREWLAARNAETQGIPQ